MEQNKDTRQEVQDQKNPAPHPPTDHNPYPYPLQQPNRKGWLKALIALIVVAVLVTLFCLVVGIFEHHEESLPQNSQIESVEVVP